jgi:hypothetical protein
MGAIRPGGGGGASSVASTDITDATATGRALVTAANAAAARTAISAAQDGAPPTVLSDALNGDGWTDVTASGGGDASWSSKLILNCGSGSASSCGVKATGYLDSGEWWDFAVRLDVVSGDASSNTRVGFVIGKDDENHVALSLWTNGTLEASYVSATSFQSLTFGSVAGITSGVRTGGQLWLRMTRTPTGVSWWWGLGSGDAMPTQWQYYYSLAEVAAAGYAARVAAAMTASSGRYVQIYALTLAAVDLDVDVTAIRFGLPGAFGGS